MIMERGKFIAYEGIDGSGKTTQVELVKAFMTEQHGETVLFKNVSPSPIGVTIRTVLDPDNKLYKNNLQMACLFIAELYVVAEKIEECLAKGINVICDRWTYSTLAYAGYTHSHRELILGMYEKILVPDVVVFLDVDPETSIKRINSRGESKELYEDVAKLKTISDRYRNDIVKELDNLVHIDIEMNDTESPDAISRYTMYRINEYIVK